MERSDAIWVLELIRERESKTLAEREALGLAIKSLQGDQRKNGIWDRDKATDVYRCSECGNSWFWINNPRYKYCPECGAKMEIR